MDDQKDYRYISILQALSTLTEYGVIPFGAAQEILQVWQEKQNALNELKLMLDLAEHPEPDYVSGNQ